MNGIIPGGNMRIWNKAIQTLCKIGDELYVEAKEDCLQLATLNANKTAYATIKFHHTFFSTYDIQKNETCSTNTDNVNGISCKIHLKSMLSIFKSRGPKDTEKKIELCKIELDSDAANIVFKLKYKHDIMMVHSLRLMEPGFAIISYSRDNAADQISSPGLFFTQILANFQTSDGDVSFDVHRNETVVKNYDAAAANVAKCIRSQVALNSNEFNVYRINKETSVTLSFKPFRAAIHFAEFFNLNVTLRFDTAGKPVILLMNSSSFEVDFVLSTMNRDGVSQSSVMTARTLVSKATEDTPPENSNISRQDRNALNNINWDSDFDANEENDGPNKRARITRNDLPNNDVDMVCKSPESPRTEKLKIVFRRCFSSSFDRLDLGEVLAPNSDSDDNT